MADLLDELRKHHAAMTPGEWLYRPDPHDDWGMIRRQHPTPEMKEIGFKFGYPLLSMSCAGLEDEYLSWHRANGTDPFEPDAAGIACLRNALPELIARLEAAENRYQSAVEIAAQAEARIAALESELDALRSLTLSQAERIQKQSDLLSKQAEKPGTPGRGLTKDEAALVYNCRHDFSEYASEESRQRLFALITRLTGDQP